MSRPEQIRTRIAGAKKNHELAVSLSIFEFCQASRCVVSKPKINYSSDVLRWKNKGRLFQTEMGPQTDFIDFLLNFIAFLNLLRLS